MVGLERGRNHKMRNVTGHPPKALQDQARAVLRPPGSWA